MSRKPMAWSWSRLQVFEQCPYRFQKQFISKQVEPFVETPPLKRGNQVHTALENFIKFKVELPADLKHLEPIIVGLKAGMKVIAEPDYAMDVNWQPCHPKAWDIAHVRGKIDVLATKDELAFQLDWKTGKPKNSDLGQLQLCSLIILAHHPELDEVHSKFVYTEHKKHSDRVVVDRDDFTELKHHFCERADRIERCIDSGKWQKLPSGLCGWCPVLHAECEHRR